MSIPLDCLYQYINNLADSVHAGPTFLFFFSPHGSKNLENIVGVNNNFTYLDCVLAPHIYCNDQEPLNFEFYQQNLPAWPKFSNNLARLVSIYDNPIIIHSEKHSIEINKYQSAGFVPCYYFNHALVSLDWYRFAQHVEQKKKVTHKFLSYNRAWSGTREYRLKFAELLINLGLTKDCKMSISPIEPELEMHYNMHKFINPIWRPAQVLENYFTISDAHSHYSAEFDLDDYQATDIEIVLETLFDDSRLHLTEKSLRPIAVGQPFIIAGTCGSLEYLRSYGFKTFGDVWDEQYDQIKDPKERLVQIADLMQHIANWLPDVRERKMAQAQEIAEHNKRLFFSKDFFNHVIQELQDNLTTALNQVEFQNTGKVYLGRRKEISKSPENRSMLIDPLCHTFRGPQTRQEIAQAVAAARKYYIRSLKKL